MDDPSAFVERTTVRELLGIPDEALAQARRIAHQLYGAGRYAQADVICRGLIACDHRLPWTYVLHAAVLRNLGHRAEALAQVHRGLTYAPDHPKLRRLRDELAAGSEARGTAPPESGSVASRGHHTGTQRAVRATDSDP